ncbi:uncharacterized protein LOC108673071 [Hyalella azteca]|uniref:Uncharacterized protein LOC108673071 n=1 Tax=Hyalella azteca TaxID=294128 RepID=A0A8B7NRK9_HYAAZ|nr:uncharacterized protein LOC108673071 [Hyalella azteca]
MLLLFVLLALSPAALGDSQDLILGQREAKLLAFFRSTSLTSIATSTKFALSTCWSTSNVACSGRRKRRALISPKHDAVRELEENLRLDSSVALPGESSASFVDNNNGVERSGRKLTVWTTGFTTVTITTTSYYAGTTVSISALCTIPGMSASCFG